ncbi:acyltransferase family protein [Enterococcus alishanensis]
MKKKDGFQLLYLAQFIFPFFVVVAHVGSLTSNPELHFLLKNILCRVVVPFYCVSNAFFYAQKDSVGKKMWLRKNIQVYLLWSLIYLPFGIQFIQDYVNLPLALYPVGVLVGLVYTGTFYHLWYFPAIFFGVVIVDKLIHKWGYGKVFSGLLVLYAIGASETYSAYLAGTGFGQLMESYFNIFLTTRNGLFFTTIFVLIGFYLAENHQRLLVDSEKNYRGLILSSLLLLIEGTIIFLHQGRDVNVYFALIPFSFYFFLVLLSYHGKADFKSLRKYGQGIYFFHMIPIQLFNIFVSTSGLTSAETGWIRWILGVGISLMVILLVDGFKKVRISDKSVPQLYERSL